jgi:hypothetical protein
MEATMAAIDIGEAKALALRARDEAFKLGSKALERTPATFSRLMEEPKSFLASFRAPPPPPPKAPWTHMAGMAALGFVAGAAALGASKAARQVGARRGSDWLEALKADHGAIEKLFEVLAKTTDGETAKRKLLLSKLGRTLARRALEVESVLYPALSEANRELAARRLAGDQFDIRGAFYALAGAPRGEPQFLAKLEALRTLVAAHAREEEDLYPSFQSGLSPEQNLKITRAILRERSKLI